MVEVEIIFASTNNAMPLVSLPNLDFNRRWYDARLSKQWFFRTWSLGWSKEKSTNFPNSVKQNSGINQLISSSITPHTC